MRLSGRQPSFQLSIAEDDDEWAEELTREGSSPVALDDDESGQEKCSHQGLNRDKETTNSKSDETTEQAAQKKIGPGDFHLLAVVGQGSFGKVNR